MDKNESSTFRVALASSDGGYTVDTHFGRAREFFVYQYFDGEWVFVEKRTLEPVCRNGVHSSDEMLSSVAAFSDCQYVIASRIGMGASSAMAQMGIVAMALPGDLMEALDKIYSYHEIQNLF